MRPRSLNFELRITVKIAGPSGLMHGVADITLPPNELSPTGAAPEEESALSAATPTPTPTPMPMSAPVLPLPEDCDVVAVEVELCAKAARGERARLPSNNESSMRYAVCIYTV